MSYDALRALIEHDEEIGSHPKQGAAFNPLLIRIRGIGIERRWSRAGATRRQSAATGQNPELARTGRNHTPTVAPDCGSWATSPTAGSNERERLEPRLLHADDDHADRPFGPTQVTGHLLSRTHPLVGDVVDAGAHRKPDRPMRVHRQLVRAGPLVRDCALRCPRRSDELQGDRRYRG
jgi:hypothetical protein